jgi:hypothetical protein
MAISEADLEGIAQALDISAAPGQAALAAMRQRFPALKFIHLDASDIEGKPIRSAQQFDLYLLDTREHCPVLTEDLSIAGAIVLTPRREERM